MQYNNHFSSHNSNPAEQIDQLHHSLTMAEAEIKKLSEEITELRGQIMQLSANDFPVGLPDTL
ncbi:MAG: hypothetical protein RRY34_08745 [Victivallaceae bacterium]